MLNYFPNAGKEAGTSPRISTSEVKIPGSVKQKGTATKRRHTAGKISLTEKSKQYVTSELRADSTYLDPSYRMFSCISFRLFI